MRSVIPNMLTSLNLVFGMGSIFATLNGNYFWASLFIVLAMVADAMDGRVARYFNASSEFGKELDSLCDLGSFGIAPAILAYSFMLHEFGWLGYAAAILFATCGALRLARFNVNTSVVKGYFMGLPIPAGGCILATFIMLDVRLAGYWFPLMVMFFGYLMVSTVHFPDFKGTGEKTRMIPVAVAVLTAGFILFQRVDAILFAPFIAYVLFGVLNTVFAFVDRR